MFLTKLKIAVGLAAAALFLAGTGSLVAIRAMGQTTPTDIAAPLTPIATAPAAPSVAPYDNPFFELVGCRIKETLSVKLTADVAPAVEANWVEQQYPQVQWTIDPKLAANVNSYSISVTLATDPAAAQTIRADKSATAQPLVDQIALPGDYDVKVIALAPDGRIVASAAAHVSINPLPVTQIMMIDIAPDGTMNFTTVAQALNSSVDPLREYQFVDSDIVHEKTITFEDGRPIPFTAQHQGNLIRYRETFNPPIAPGAAAFDSSIGTITEVVRNLGGGLFACSITDGPIDNVPTRRMELCRLPAGAKLVYSTPNLLTKTVDGRVQAYFDAIIPTGGSDSYSFRYRVAAN
jgi:hypothetical protein